MSVEGRSVFQCSETTSINGCAHFQVIVYDHGQVIEDPALVGRVGFTGKTGKRVFGEEKDHRQLMFLYPSNYVSMFS